jgi:hypothetical protein
MAMTWTALCIGGLLAAPGAAAAQDILIDPGLAGNAYKLPVKKGPQWPFKIAKWRFGEFAVASSKMGATTTTSNLPIFTFTDKRKGTNKFSFVLVNASNDSAQVRAEHLRRVMEGRSIASVNGWSVDADMPIEVSDQFSASIVVAGDTTETWTLTRLLTDGSDVERTYEAILTDGERTIVFEPASVRMADRKPLASPAYGYEFFEGEESIGAVQYQGGTFGQTYIVWLRKDLGAGTRLVLAAAMTALLQMTSNDAMP